MGHPAIIVPLVTGSAARKRTDILFQLLLMPFTEQMAYIAQISGLAVVSRGIAILRMGGIVVRKLF